MRKYLLVVIALLLLAVLAGCQSSVEQAVEATVEVQQEKIDTFFAVAEAHVVAAIELTNALPSQQAKADLLLQDLEEINKRLNEAVETEADVKVAALEAVAQQIETVKATVEEILETAVDQVPEEAKDALEQLQNELEELQKKVQDEIESVKKELGQEIDETLDAAEDAAEDAKDDAEQAVEDKQDETQETIEAVEDKQDEAQEAVEAAEEESEDSGSSD
jgi:chromosome segregation ATPase